MCESEGQYATIKRLWRRDARKAASVLSVVQNHSHAFAQHCYGGALQLMNFQTLSKQLDADNLVRILDPYAQIPRN